MMHNSNSEWRTPFCDLTHLDSRNGGQTLLFSDRSSGPFSADVPLPFPSSVRSAMFVAKAYSGSQAPLGAAWLGRPRCQPDMPLLTELEDGPRRSRRYKHAAPNGAIRSVQGCDTSELTCTRRWLISVVIGLCIFFSSCLNTAHAAPLPPDWPHEQHFDAPAAGLLKLSLPTATLDAARPGLEDLRLYDDAGREVPYLIEHPKPVGKVVRDAKSFQVAVNASTTVLTLETGLAQPLDGVTIASPATAFLKAVHIQGSADGQGWQTLARGQPIFRQPDGVSQLRLAIPVGTWPWLRLTVDDERSQPIPFTGARVHAAAVEPVPSEAVPVTIVAHDENPGQTRLTVSLGAANLDVASVGIETTEPLFTRQVTLAAPQVEDGTIREQPLAHGVIYRVAVEGQPESSLLAVPLESLVRSRELLVLIENKDSPPLPITAVRAERRPVYLVFLAHSADSYHLLTGNSRYAAPRYDLAALGANLKTAAVAPLGFSPLADNPNYRPPEVLVGIQEGGTALDVSEWKYRQGVKLTRPGAQSLELDLDVLSHAQPGFGDLRLVSAGKQLPYILEPTSISRSLTPTLTTASDKKDPQLSRWIIKLPRPALPLTRLSCTARTPLLQRDVSLYEELSDDRGEKYRRPLGTASWIQIRDRTSKRFTLRLESPPSSDTLVLETRNGDNPPIELEKFQAFYPATRILFKAQPVDALFLYYGNQRAAAPRYDLSLVAGQLLAADQSEATLASEEKLKTSWGEGRRPGTGGVVFWGMLAVVVVVLLIIIARLLPQSSRPS
jgi:hypothetical protein